jgi:hypothetical protein
MEADPMFTPHPDFGDAVFAGRGDGGWLSARGAGLLETLA